MLGVIDVKLSSSSIAVETISTLRFVCFKWVRDYEECASCFGR